MTAGVEVLDLSTLRWSSGLVPNLPEPRSDHAVCGFSNGRVVVLDKKSKKVVGSSTLSKRGVAGLRLRTNRTGKHAFVARYVGGGSNIERSQQVFRLRLR